MTFYLTRYLNIAIILVIASYLSACRDASDPLFVEISTPLFEDSGAQYEIFTSVTAGGSLVPESTIVDAGGLASFHIDAHPGYALDSITGCNGAVNEKIRHSLMRPPLARFICSKCAQ